MWNRLFCALLVVSSLAVAGAVEDRVASLKTAAWRQYPLLPRISHESYGMAQYNIVEHEGRQYALTSTLVRGPRTYAVWLFEDGTWRWLFGYYNLVELESSPAEWNKRVDFLYKQFHDLDPELRRALENPDAQRKFPGLRDLDSP